MGADDDNDDDDDFRNGRVRLETPFLSWAVLTTLVSAVTHLKLLLLL